MCTQIILIDIDNSTPTTSFNTNKLFDNLDTEQENLYYSDYDDSDKDPDYEPPVQTLEVSYEGKQSLIFDINIFSTKYRILHLQKLLLLQVA